MCFGIRSLFKYSAAQFAEQARTRGGGGGMHWVHVHPPPPHPGKKFRSEMSTRGEKVPPRYVGKKECARSAQIRQNINEKGKEKEEKSKRKGIELKK